MSGLFGTFNVAKRGMFVQQKALDVTSHNIANANTEGYSRQRAKIETTRPFGMPSINSVAEPGQLGTGSQIAAIERIRDSFLDYQVRNETSTFGQYDTRNKFLSEIESILNEPKDTGISNLMTKFFNSWQDLSKKANDSNARTVVAQQSKDLADSLNHTYNQLTKLKENAQNLIKGTVFEVNNIVSQIDQLNQEIMAVKVAGNMPNDLMDKRDLLLDQLSSKFNINIDKKSFEGVNVNPGDGGLNLVKAVQNKEDVYRLSYISNIKETATPGEYEITYYKFGNMESENNKKTITVSGLSKDEAKKIDECRILWADLDGNAVDVTSTAAGSKPPLTADKDKLLGSLFSPNDGEFKGLISIQEDVNSYIGQVNKLAKALAWSVNALHTNNDTNDPTKNVALDFFVAKDGKTESEITAENITVNPEIIKDVMKIYTQTTPNSGESDGPRALAIAQLRDVLMKVQNIGVSINSRADLFDAAKGGNTLKADGLGITNNLDGVKLDGYFKDTVDRLGVQSQQAKRMVKNQLDLLDSFMETRMSVSGVSIDEEIANMIQFQHAYQANAKIISTIDELLDVVVNGLKR